MAERWIRNPVHGVHNDYIERAVRVYRENRNDREKRDDLDGREKPTVFDDRRERNDRDGREKAADFDDRRKRDDRDLSALRESFFGTARASNPGEPRIIWTAFPTGAVVTTL